MSQMSKELSENEYFEVELEESEIDNKNTGSIVLEGQLKNVFKISD
jgi:hypothetical protein